MEKYLFMRPVLHRLAGDAFFSRALAFVLKAGAAILVFASLATFFKAGKLTFDLPANGVLGGILFEIFFVLGIYVAVQVLIVRAEDIAKIAPGEWIALRTAPILVRALAEAYAGFVTMVAIGGGVFVWFTNLSLSNILNPLVRSLFPSIRHDPSFMGGIEFMLSGVVAAAMVLVVAYVVAEGLMFMLRPAKAQETTRRTSEGRTSEERLRSRFGS